LNFSATGADIHVRARQDNAFQPTTHLRSDARCRRISQKQKTAVSERLILDIAF